MTDEAISDFTKEVDGKTVPMWSREEIDEIIIAQVCDRSNCTAMWTLYSQCNTLYFYQSTLFMLAGFDTTATTLTNTCFQLARNPDVQEKLYESIAAKMEEYVSQQFKSFKLNLLNN